jgi:glycopeptide antibiotics resistance protein
VRGTIEDGEGNGVTPRSALGRLAFAVAVVGLLVALYFTLFPFDFVSQDTSLSQVLRKFSLDTGPVWMPRAMPANTLLLVPLGLGLGGLGSALGWSRRWVAVRSAAVGLVLSTAIELTQATWLLREPSIDDIVANTAGAALGGWLWTRFEPRIGVLVYRLRVAVRRRRWRYLVFALSLLPAVLVLLNTFRFRHDTERLQWDSQYPLVMGNEPTGDRPWSGSISEVSLTDRTLTRQQTSEWLTGSPIRDLAPESTVLDLDFTTATTLPAGWELQPSDAANGDLFVDGRLELGPTRWLQMVAPAGEISRRINDSGSFTLAIDAAASSSDQSGPARLVSISTDAYHRDLTVAQDGSDLVVRLRSAFTGTNGDSPEYALPGVFSDDRSHRFVITYDASSIRVAVDEADNTMSIDLLPTAVPMIETFTDEISRVRFSSIGNLLRDACLAALMFVPWSVCVALLRGGRGSRTGTVLLVLAPVLASEILLTLILPFHPFRVAYVVVVGAATVLVAVLVSLRPVQPRPSG